MAIECGAKGAGYIDQQGCHMKISCNVPSEACPLKQFGFLEEDLLSFDEYAQELSDLLGPVRGEDIRHMQRRSPGAGNALLNGVERHKGKIMCTRLGGPSS